MYIISTTGVGHKKNALFLSHRHIGTRHNHFFHLPKLIYDIIFMHACFYMWKIFIAHRASKKKVSKKLIINLSSSSLSLLSLFYHKLEEFVHANSLSIFSCSNLIVKVILFVDMLLWIYEFINLSFMCT
jgi:hypothetical protein